MFFPTPLLILRGLFQVTYLPFTVFTVGLLLCSEVFLPHQLPVMGSFLQLSRCTELGVRKSKFGFYETFGVGDALKPPCVFRIFGYLFPLAFEIYVTPNFIPFPLIPFQLGFHVGDHVLLSANAQSLRILPCGLTIFAHSPRRFF